MRAQDLHKLADFFGGFLNSFQLHLLLLQGKESLGHSEKHLLLHKESKSFDQKVSQGVGTSLRIDSILYL